MREFDQRIGPIMRPRNLALERLALLSLVLLGLYGCATSGAEFWYNRGVRAHHSLSSKISHYTKAIELKPDYAYAYNNRGSAYSSMGLHDKAITDLSKAIILLEMEGDEQPLVFAYNNRGKAYHLKGQYDRAIRDYTEVIRLKPDYAIGFYNRGLAYKIKGHNDQAIRDYTEAIRLKPDYAYAYNNRGVAYSSKGRHDKAVTDLNKAITLLEMKGDKPKLAIAYNSRASAFQGKGSYDRAIADLNKVIELDPNSHAFSHLAWVYATSPDAVFRNGKRAVELAEKALKLGRDGHNLDVLSAAYAAISRFEEAIDIQLQAIDLLKLEVPNKSVAGFEKHLARYRSHKPWRMSVPGGVPDFTATVMNLNDLAEQYRAQGKYAEAEPLYQQALAIREKELGPQHEAVATSLNNLALLYRAQGKNGKTEPLYKRSLAIRVKARQREEARKRKLRQILEALSGRYTTAGGRSQWDISFRDNRFEARYLNTGKRNLLYDGTVVGTRIEGRKHHGGSSLCRRLPTTPLYGSVDLRRKSFEIFWRDFKLVEMRRHKRCVPITAQTIWTQADRQ